MKPNEFTIFCRLIHEVHLKAFHEPLDELPHGKAQALRWLIFDQTGELISYKTLQNYVHAVQAVQPDEVNPHLNTLNVLVLFSQEHQISSARLAWFGYLKKQRFAE